MSSLIFINCYAYIDVVIHCLKYLIINLNAYYSHDHCAVYVCRLIAKANSFIRQKLAGQIHAFTAGENSSIQTMDSRRCLNSASSQRQAGEIHAAKTENCNARLAIQPRERQA
jgi:hypothetical protein